MAQNSRIDTESALAAAPAAPPDGEVAEVYFGFSTTRIWLSRWIRAFTGSKYSHCWVLHPSRVWGGMWITHADWPVVRQWPVQTASAQWSVEKLYRPRFDAGVALQAARPMFEKPYDVLGLFGMIPVMLASLWFKHRIKNPFASRDKLFCSEFVAQIWIHAKLPGTEGWDPATLDPRTAEEYCAAHPELFEPVDPDTARKLLLATQEDEAKALEALPPRQRKRNLKRFQHAVFNRERR